MTAHYFINSPTPNTSRIVMQTNHTGTHLDFPVPKDDLKALIRAAFNAPDSSPRIELHGVFADKTPTGVRLRCVADASWFDIPWSVIAQGVFDEE